MWKEAPTGDETPDNTTSNSKDKLLTSHLGDERRLSDVLIKMEPK